MGGRIIGGKCRWNGMYVEHILSRIVARVKLLLFCDTNKAYTIYMQY